MTKQKCPICKKKTLVKSIFGDACGNCLYTNSKNSKFEKIKHTNHKPFDISFSVSEWQRIGREREYFKYYENVYAQKVAKKIVDAMSGLGLEVRDLASRKDWEKGIKGLLNNK